MSARHEAISECMAVLRDAEQLANDDPEVAHSHADKALCGLLAALGLEDVVLAYDKVSPKWYA